MANGLFTPEGLYPLTGVHTLPLNYPSDANGLPDLSTSVGQGATILESTILGNTATGDTSTVFGYSQSSTLSGITMQQLDPTGANDPGLPDALHFLLIADPSAPNGGLLERFDGFDNDVGSDSVRPVEPAESGYRVRRRHPVRRLRHQHLLARVRRLHRLPALPDQLPVRPQRVLGYRDAARHVSERRRRRERSHGRADRQRDSVAGLGGSTAPRTASPTTT